MLKSTTTQISSIVSKHFEKLKEEINAEELRPRPLPNELELINKAYKDIKILPCERLTNHCDHFKFEHKPTKTFVYLTTRDIGYGDYWKLMLLEKIKSQNNKLVNSNKQRNAKDYYISSFIEKITIFDGEQPIATTPNDYLTTAEYSGYCRPNVD